MAKTETLPERRCEKCKVLLYKGRLEGEIKCRRCGMLQKSSELKYNHLTSDKPKSDN